jgi:hypothetical protein
MGWRLRFEINCDQNVTTLSWRWTTARTLGSQQNLLADNLLQPAAGAEHRA